MAEQCEAMWCNVYPCIVLQRQAVRCIVKLFKVRSGHARYSSVALGVLKWRPVKSSHVAFCKVF